MRPACTRCSDLLWREYRSGRLPVIPDIKCSSPAEGDLLRGRDPLALAGELAAAGAPLLSVVTEGKHFGGSPQLLQKIAGAVAVPVLRKDFITTRKQLLETAECGAAGVLLIAARLGKKQLLKLIEEALLLGLEPLVETHNEAEIMAANELNLTFLGINNRDILLLETDDGSIDTTEKLAGLVRPGALVLSESSLMSRADLLRAMRAGAYAALVGTAILQAEDPGEFYRQLSRPWRQDIIV
jgi:indole-3-glycerol phosphate synthase